MERDVESALPGATGGPPPCVDSADSTAVIACFATGVPAGDYSLVLLFPVYNAVPSGQFPSTSIRAM